MMILFLKERKKEKRMRRFDRINSVLPDNLMVEIFRYLESEEDREAFSLVCKRWLNLERLSRGTIHISFTDGTDALLKLLTNRYVNVHDVSIDESPWTSLSPKPKRGDTCLINRFPLKNQLLLSKSKQNEMRKYCLSNSGLATIGDGFTKLESLRLISCSNVTDAGLISIAEKCKLLKSLDLKWCCVGDKSLAAIGKYCTRLEVLNLMHCESLTDTGLVQLAVHCGRTLKSLGLCVYRGLTDVSLEAVGFYCTSLETLSIELEFISDKGLLSIAKGCYLLKSLKIQCKNITDEALQVVGSFCLSLELLALYRCWKLTDRSLYAIGKGCKKLKNLSLNSCYSVSELGLDSIAVGCPELMFLEVNSCFHIGTSGLKSIGKACIHFSELVLQHLSFQQLGNDVLREIGIGWKYLQSLSLIDCEGIGDETLCGITRGCRNLKKLYILGCEVGNKGVICVGKNCKFLTVLHLNFCNRVSDDGIIGIARACPQLSCLDVSGLKYVGDDGMAAVGEGCPLLKDLAISDCQEITDDGLRYIARNCKLLESCNMMSCSSITKFGVTTLMTGCQKIKELWVEERKFS